MALRDSTIAVNWDVSGAGKLRQTDKEIEESVASAEDLENQAGQAGQELEQAGERGERSFTSLTSTVDKFSEELQTVAAGGLGVGAAGVAGTAFMTESAGDLQDARTAIRAQADEHADALIREAESFENFTNSAVQATEVMQSQRMLLRSDALSGETVAQLTGALGNLAVAYDRDLRDVFEEVRDPLFEAEGATQLVTKGFIRNQEEIFRSIGVWEEGIRTFRKYREEFGTVASRQLIVNELMRKGRREQSAAAAQLDTLNARWSGFVNEIDMAAAIMGGDFAREQEGLLAGMTRFIRQTRKQNPQLLEFAGNLTVLGTAVATVTGSVAALALTVGGISAVFGGVSIAAVLGIGATIAGVTALVTEIGALIVTGETLVAGDFFGLIGRNIAFAASRLGSFVNETLGLEGKLNDISGWIDKWFVNPMDEAISKSEQALQNIGLLPEENEVPSGPNQMMQTPGAGAVPGDVGLPSLDFVPQPSPSPAGAGAGGTKKIEIDIRADGETKDEREAGRRVGEALKKELQKEQAVEVEGAK